LSDEGRKGVALGAIARIYQLLEDHENALKYDIEALRIAVNIGDSANLAINYNNVGADYNNLNNYDSAIINYKNALNIAENTENIKLLALLHLNMGYAYQKNNEIDSALINLREAEKLYNTINDNHGLANTYNKLAEYYKDKNNDSLLIFANKALRLAEKTGSITIIRQSSGLLSEAYEKTEQYDSAYKYLSNFNKLNDSIINSGNTRKITQLEMNYEFEKEREINEIKHREEVKRQQTFTIYFITAFILSLLLVLLIFRNYRLKKKSEQKLQQLNAVKDKFFRIISHDLKAPFNAFISISETLSDPDLNLSKEKVQYFANSINKAAKNSYDLFKNLLIWSVSQREGLKIKKQEIKIHKIIKNTVEILKSSADEKNIDIKIEAKTEMKIISDENILQTVLRNLISNAIKFTPERGIITVSVQFIDDEFKIKVKDSGIGIAEEDLVKLFKPEIHYTTTGTNKEKGTGLGLILCKELIEKTGGNISVKSTLNTGSEFTITIPV